MKCDESNYIKRLKKKKEDALEFIVDKYLGHVKRSVYKILDPLDRQDVMEECINDIFLAIWNHSDQFEGEEEDFKKWIYKVSKYQVTLNETKEELIALINTLQPIGRKIFIMKYFLGIQSEEIARQLGISRTAVDNQVYRGNKKLKNNITKLGWEVI